MTTIAIALRSARQRLAPVSDSASGDAQALLGHVLGVERPWLLAHPEHVLTTEQSAAFEALVARCAGGEPLPYVLGRRAWYDRDFIVTPDVLIPRPETELLLEQALAWANGDRDSHNKGRDNTDAMNGAPTDDPVGSPFMASARTTGDPPIAVDVGTGSGILAVTFAALQPGWEVHAVDVSEAALGGARRNAALHGVTRQVMFAQSDLLAQWDTSKRIDLLMANLPYIPSADAAALPVARHEPLLALDGGADGLELIRRLLVQAARVMRPGGLMLLEIETRQGAAAAALAREVFPTSQVAVLRDYAGHDRIVRIALPD